MKGAFRSLVASVSHIGVLPGDNSDQKLKKTLLLISAGMMSLAGILWGALYLWLGEPTAAMMPIAYSLISWITLLIFARTGEYHFLRKVQLTSSLLLPMLMMVALGGFIASSAVALWSVTAPIGALVFASRKAGAIWFVAFVTGLIGFGVLAPIISPDGASQITPLARSILFVLNISGASLVVLVLMNYFASGKAAALKLVEIERAKVGDLLNQILPPEIAVRMTERQTHIADHLDEVTILFADIVNFTEMSRRMTAEELVQCLEEVFSVCDEIADQLNLEKIKTIGDAYMLAGSAPLPQEDHALHVADFARQLHQRLALRPDGLQMRVGIAIGPAVGGVIGECKFFYDVWGETVNLAARLEQASKPRQTLVSSETKALLPDRYAASPALISLKGFDEVQAYWLASKP